MKVFHIKLRWNGFNLMGDSVTNINQFVVSAENENVACAMILEKVLESTLSEEERTMFHNTHLWTICEIKTTSPTVHFIGNFQD